MKDKQLTLEEQLRSYANAIDPNNQADERAHAPAQRRGPSVRATWLAAAAAVLTLAGIAVVAQRDPVQQVETGGFAQQPEQQQDSDGVQSDTDAPVTVGTGSDPIYWPGGSTDPIETVERFLDLSFPQWRDLDLTLRVGTASFGEEPTVTSRALVEIKGPDLELFASIPMRFGDGRWFLEEISSPVLQLDMTRQLTDNTMEGTVVSEASGELAINIVYPFERTVQSTTAITITNDQRGAEVPVSIQKGHQEVQALLVSLDGDLLAIVAFTATGSRPPEWVANNDNSVIGLPLPDGVPPTGDLRTREEALVVMLAELTLLNECMTVQGVPFAMPTNDEWIELFGGWQPQGILGIGRAGAARRLGYQGDGWGGAGSPSQSAAWQAMTTAEQNAFVAALRKGPPFAPGPVPTATATAQGLQVGGCWTFAEAMLGDQKNRRVEFDQLLGFGSDETQGERFRTDPILAGAIADWQDCIRQATGIDADTPNTLARQYAFERSTNAEREREVALADIACQQATNLEEQFYIARTKQLRNELGDDVTVFDDYVRFRIETVRLAQQILDERSITPPPLD